MKKIIIIIGVLGLLAVSWYLLSPLFINKEVSEDLPEDFNFPTEEEIADMTTEEKMEMEKKMLMESEDMQDVVVEDSMDEAKEMMDMPSVSSVLSAGIFGDADSFHKGSGNVSILDNGQGSQVVRFENFNVTNGPDLRVLLSTSENPTSHDTLGSYIELGKLKGNMGDQNYSVPSGVDASIYKSVVIYCKPFQVVFSTATLK